MNVYSHVSNNMGITQVDPECLCRVDSSIHACQDEILLRRRQREVSLRERR